MIIRDITEWLAMEGFACRTVGNQDISVNGFSSLANYKSNTITWVKRQDNYDDLQCDSIIRCAIVQTGVNINAECCIETDTSKQVFFKVLEHFWGEEEQRSGIGKGTVVGENVKIGQGVKIGNNCVITGKVIIGNKTIIDDNVTIMNQVDIGSNCRIHAGAVIGKDGFGYSFNEEDVAEHIRHYGGVHIGNRVEIGANCVIDRGTIDNTEIGDDTKIDSLTIVGHNCLIGSKVMIIGGILIGGSCKIGDKSYISPGAMIKNQVSIGTNSFVGMGVFVNNNIGDNEAMIKNGSTPVQVRKYRRFL